MELRILGPLEAVVDGAAVDLGPPKVRALLAMLVIHRGQVVSTDALVEGLWGEEPPEGAVATLRTYVSLLRRALSPDVIETRPPGYRLAVSAEQVDGGRFEALVGEGRHPEALGLWRGPALGEFAEASFASAEAARLEELRMVATEEQIDAELAQGLHQAVVGRLQALVEAHPLRERLWGQLILALYRSGRQAEALRAYATLRRRLGEELGIDPGPTLRALEADVLAQDPALDWLPPAVGSEVPTNLAAPRSSFVGRAEELEELDKLLVGPGLVTLVGPGGVGKTRLAIEAARGLRPRFADGVWLAELAPLSDPALVPQAVATAVGVREEPGRPLIDTLARALAPKTTLIVLDNCEHVVAAAASLADALLAAVPGLGILATSREPLRVEGEVLWSTPSLPVPERDDLAPEALAGIDAVRLFCERAASQGPFALDADNATAVSGLCRRLDGIPLAIELAAARTAALSPAHILERLDRRFRLLTAGRRAVPRHQTLQAAVEWSHDLLSAEERTLFRRLSVFRGFPLDAAEQVCADDGLQRHQVASLLADLVDRSLVVAHPQGDGTVRYSLLETLRTFAAERLGQSGEEERILRSHAEWIAELADQARAASGGRDSKAWDHRLELEHDNLRQALRWSLVACPEHALRMVAAAGQFWGGKVYLTEGRQWLEAALAAAPDAPADLRAMPLANAGILAMRQGDYRTAQPFLEQAIALRRVTGDKTGLGRALGFLGFLHTEKGELHLARLALEESIAIHCETGDELQLATTSDYLGLVAARRGDFETAVRLHEEALMTLRRVAGPTRYVVPLENLASTRLGRGELDAARPLFREALSIFRETNNAVGVALALGGLGRVALHRDDLATARNLFEEARDVARAAGVQQCLAEALRGLAEVSLREGRPDLAGSLLREGTRAQLGGGTIPPETIEQYASIALALEQYERAGTLFGAAGTLRESMGSVVPPVDLPRLDRDIERVRARLDPDRFRDTWSRGQAMSAHDALHYASGE